jgi:YD repeat-containing protein
MALEEATGVRPKDTNNPSENNKEGEKDRKVADETNLSDPANSRAATAERPIMTATGLPGVEIFDSSKLKTENKIDAKNFFPEPGDGMPEGEVTKDDQGRVTAIEYPNGTKREIGYGEDGQINRVVQPTGEVLVLVDGKWEYETKGGDGGKPGTNLGGGGEKTGIGAKPNKAPDFSNPSVSGDGTFRFEQADGSRTAVFTDGTSMRSTEDGARIFANDKGQVTSIRYKNGDSRSFNYDIDGNLIGFQENGEKYTVNRQGEILDKKGEKTGRKDAVVTADGKFSYTDEHNGFVTINTDRTSEIAKNDKSFVHKDADGNITDVKYPDGTTQQFGYDENGNLQSITDKNGKTYQFKGFNLPFGIDVGYFEAEDGSKLTGVRLDDQGNLRYRDEAGKIHNDYTSGNSTETTKTAAELAALADEIRDNNGVLNDGKVLNKLDGLSEADLVALDQIYEREHDKSLYETLKGQQWNPWKKEQVNEALLTLSGAHLRTEALKQFSGEELETANETIDEFQKRAAEQGVSPEKIFEAQDKALEQLKKGDKSPDELLKNLETTLSDTAPTLESLNSKYGVRSDQVTLPDGTTTRQYYVEGPNGEKLPVLDSNSDDPVEVERQLREWQENKIKDLEGKYNVEFSREGQSDKGSELRPPRIDELMALEDGLKRSEASTSTHDGRPILVQFAKTPTSPYDAYVQGRPDGQQRILFEPLNRDYTGLRDTIIHEWAHNAQHNLNDRDPEGLNKVYEQMGYRKVTDASGQEQWQFRDKDGNYWTQDRNQLNYPFGRWTRVDDQGRPLDKDGNPVSGFDDPKAQTQSTGDMQNNADVKPTTAYFPNPGENGAEAQILFRSGEAQRTELYLHDPKAYEAAKAFDQLELDTDPRYGRNADGSSKFIRLPDGTIAENTEANRQAVIDYEATLPAAREQHQREEEEKKNRRPGSGILGLPGVGGGGKAAGEGAQESAGPH